MLRKILLFIILGLGLYIIFGCILENRISSIEADRFPDKLIEFHIERNLSIQNEFVLTVFKPPFNGSFWYIQLRDNNMLNGEFIQDWGIDAGRRIRLQHYLANSKKKKILDSLYLVSQEFAPVHQDGEYVLTLSQVSHMSNAYHVLSCLSNNCPPQLCFVYRELINVIENDLTLYPREACLEK
ncbi:MAG: hypothetical protein OEY93_07490 [Anaerolineae bacterium]|nr:hypothetical protein [Anaerolineae bacterium]